ncbi:MAG: DUF192 domain-containing protein [Firmicutes bacterium]|nr:DUF192 domain-containing protein [Bacillota bacterium]
MGLKEVCRVVNATRGVELASSAQVAASFLERLVGLLGRKGLHPGEGLIIQPCNSVHTFLMRFPIDVLFLDAEGTIVHMWSEMPPNRATWVVWAAKRVVELPAGTLLATGTRPGERVEIQTKTAGFSNPIYIQRQ